MKNHTLTATSLIVAFPYAPGRTIKPGTSFRRADYDGDADMLRAIDRAIAKGGCMVDGHFAGGTDAPDPVIGLTNVQGEPIRFNVSTGAEVR